MITILARTLMSLALLGSLVLGCDRARPLPPRIPNLICRGDTGLYVLGRTLRADKVVSETVYTIRNDSLLIAEPGKQEFHYNTLSLPQPYRATTYFLTINFIDDRFDGRAVMLRDHWGDASIVQLRCSLAAGSPP
jgi:hypothetical protein